MNNQNQFQETKANQTLEEQNQCPSEMIQEYSYVHENGCNLTCPSEDSQTEVIPEVCQQPELRSPLEEQLDQPIETSNNLHDPVTNENNSDTNIGFLDSRAIDKDTLKGKDIRSESIGTANSIYTNNKL